MPPFPYHPRGRSRPAFSSNPPSEESVMSNPLLDHRRSARLRPHPAGTRRTRPGCPAGRLPGGDRTPDQRGAGPDLGELRRAPGGDGRHPEPHLVAGRAPERGHEQRRPARRLQRLPAQAQRLRHRGRPERGPVPRLPGGGRPGAPGPHPAQAGGERPARLPPVRGRPARRPEGALQGHQPGTVPTHQQVFGESAGRHQRLEQADHRRGATGRAAGIGPGSGPSERAAARARRAGC